jgi:hypothetical protein
MEDKRTFENRGATLIRNFSLKVGGQLPEIEMLI